jgi:hypothetical protein
MNSTSLRHPTSRSHKSTSNSPKSAANAQRNGWTVSPDEAVIADIRANSTPAEAVESKLRYLLRSHPIGVSHLMTACLAARRPR